MPYITQSWEDGKTGTTFEATAAKFKHMEEGIFLSNGPLINVKEAPYSAKGNGVTNDAKVINEALAVAGPGGEELTVLIPPGTYALTEALKIPPNVSVLGLDERTCVFLVKGNFAAIQCEGGNTIGGFSIRSESKQTSGSAFSIVGNAVNIKWHDITVGSKFFNGFFLVPTTESGGYHFHSIHFSEPGTGVKEYGNAAFVIGSSTGRVVAVMLHDIHGQAAAEADMPKWFEINNVDSCLGINIGLQFGKEGVCVGNADTSTLKTTGLHLTNIWCDTLGTAGYKIEHVRDCVLTAANAQNCGEGIFYGPEAIGARLIGGTIQSNKRHGIRIGPTVLSVSIADSVITDNNSNGELEAQHIAGIYIEKGARGVKITGNDIGNLMFYGEKQNYGVYLEAAAANVTKNIFIQGNRIPEKGTGAGSENKTKAIANELTGTEAESKVSIANNLLS